MLNNCKLRWASKVRKALGEGKEVERAEPISDGLRDRLEKVMLMRDMAQILRDEEFGKGPFGDEEKKQKLEKECSEWERVEAAMGNAANKYGVEGHSISVRD